MRLRLLAVPLAALAFLPATGSSAATPAPTVKSCGNLAPPDGLLIGDITAKRVTCKDARLVARSAVRACGTQGSCRVRGFTCLTARAAPELRFARCSKAVGNDELHEVVRFDFGS